ncbi:uncharacterized protein LOC129592442 [Paramacrobiotus metropolitanus]|uniref:uncharacterized protein LOC129592442 n=1 Tax=Paramacrobiotus metropolitanus TaxID=2943436 RepID=UPI002445E905|nr:uncharacterized protein LOC129592442 [Paramacrobiotus metropolitanus]
MLIFGDDEDAAWPWNAVDALVDGQLQHGRVINLADKGLIIDFECPAQRAQFVEYGRVFHYTANTGRSNVVAVQVLLRRHPDGVWIWYPGRVIQSSLCKKAEYVEAQLPQGNVKELLPLAQVRPAPAEGVCAEGRVRRGDFVIRSCQMPAGGLSNQPPRIVKKFKAELNEVGMAIFVSLLGETLTYLQIQDAQPLKMRQLKIICELARKRKPPTRSSQPAAIPITLNNGPRSSRKRKNFGSDDEGMRLPVELLVELFQSLDSIGQVRCRRVCALWNTLLTTDAYFPDVRVSGNCADGDYPAVYFSEDGMYWVVECVLKCLSSHTKMLGLSRMDLFECRQLMAPIHHALPGRRLPLLVLHNCNLSGPLPLMKRARDVIASTAQLAVECGCERMLWQQCRLSDASLTALVPRYAFRDLSLEPLTVQLWDLFERHRVLEEPLDRPAVAQWIADCVGHPRRWGNQSIVQGLQAYQSADPRPATRYRHRAWTASTLAQLDVTQLTTLTTAFLQGLTPQFYKA